MKDIIIVSAGDFARETAWLIERINQKSKQWNLLGFVDDKKAGQVVDGYPVLGDIDWLCHYDQNVLVTCAIGTGSIREKIWAKLSTNPHLSPATLIDPAAIVGKNCTIGKGSIICAGTILTIAVTLGQNCIVNLNCTLGHDTILDNYCTIHPGTNISGRVQIEKCTDIGTGSKVIPGRKIAPYTTIGAGAVVAQDLTEPGTYVGVPARRLK